MQVVEQADFSDNFFPTVISKTAHVGIMFNMLLSVLHK